jgi:hypothetical protein
LPLIEGDKLDRQDGLGDPAREFLEQSYTATGEHKLASIVTPPDLAHVATGQLKRKLKIAFIFIAQRDSAPSSFNYVDCCRRFGHG